jgi:type IV secretory pathway TrbF-like protein
LGSTSSALTQTVNKAAATVTLGNMTQTYTGSPLTPTATTNPAGLTIVWTNAPQTGPGSYEVTATVNDTNYQGSASGTFVISQADNDAPTINCTVPNQANWYGSDVLVPCTASDSGSGLADPNDASFNLSTSVANGIETSSAQTNTHQVCDNNSNCATAGPYTFKVDRKAPVVSCGSADSIWHADNQSVACTSSDGGSGLANSADASFTLSTTVVSGDETASAATGSKTVADGVGNSSTAGPYTFKVDRKAPVVSCGSADSIWHADNQSVAYTASDGGSGLANSADASFTLSTTVASGTETASASTGSKTVADSLGNTETAGPYTFKVDRKAPQLVSCDTSDGAWHATDVTLKCNYTDGGSGMTTAFVSLTTNVVAGTETTNAVASAGGAQACDNAGNCAASPANISGNRIDKKAPVLSCGSPDSIWHASDQSVTCTATDGGSGLAISGDASFTLSTNVPVGTEANNASTGTHDVSDAVGNSATAGPVSGFMIDKKAPVINCTVPDQSIWYGNNVTVNCTASDAGSGLAVPVDATFTLSTSVASGVETASAATGSKMVSDGVGNSDTVGPYTFKVDKKGPSITINKPSATNYFLNQAIAANYSCSDGGSGLDSCIGTVANGSNIDTTTVGSKTFKVTATDNVGNTTSASVSYSVQYIFSGFSAPVENMPIVNLAKAGQAIPIKWRLTDANGNPVSDPLNFTSVTASSSNASCGGSTDAIETYAGNSGLLYNGNGNWQFNWKTPKYYAGLCLTMKLTLSDGTTHDAYFSFK